jgi:hypothetical protein
MMRKQERPPLPARTDGELRNLIELCWAPVPEKRITFERVWELFVSHKVAFEGTDSGAVDKFATTVNEWNISHPFKSEEDSLTKILGILKSSNPMSILLLIEQMTLEIFRPFLRAMMAFIGTKENDDMAATALFVVLTVVSRNEECLEHFARSVRWENLQIGNPKLSEIALSLVIPVIERYPKTIDAELLRILHSQVSHQPIKTLRVVETITGNMDDETFDSGLCNFFLEIGHRFIQNTVGTLYLNCLFKFLHRLRSFRANKSKGALAVLVAALSAPDFEVVKTAITILRSLRPITFTIDSPVLLRLLDDEPLSVATLKLLIVSKPGTLYIELIEWLIKHFESNWAVIVLLSLCRTEDGILLMISNPDTWLLRSGFPNHIQFQILLTLLGNGTRAHKVIKLKTVPKLFVNILSEGDLVSAKAVATVIKKFQTDASSMKRLVDWTFIVTAITRKDEDLLMKIYLFITTLLSGGYVSDFLLLLRLVPDHLQENSKLGIAALEYLELLITFPEGLMKVKQTNIGSLLTQRLRTFNPQMKVIAERIRL